MQDASHIAKWRAKYVGKGTKYIPINESTKAPPQSIEDTQGEISVSPHMIVLIISRIIDWTLIVLSLL